MHRDAEHRDIKDRVRPASRIGKKVESFTQKKSPLPEKRGTLITEETYIYSYCFHCGFAATIYCPPGMVKPVSLVKELGPGGEYICSSSLTLQAI